MNSTKHKMMAFAIILAMALSVVPAFLADQYDGSAQQEDITVSPSVSTLTVKGGDVKTIYIDILNKQTYTEEDPNTLVVYVTLKPTDGISATYPNGQRVVVDGQKIECCCIELHVDEFIHTQNMSLTFTITINDPDREAPITTEASDIVILKVKSNYMSEQYINKILGIWENPFTGVFAGSAFAAIISFIAFILMADIISNFAFPYAVNGMRKYKEFNRMFPKRDLAFEANKILFALLSLVALYMAARIYGLNEVLMAVLYKSLQVFAVIIGATIVFNLYGYLLERVLAWFDDDIDDGRKSSSYSLMFIIGKILIFTCAIYLVLLLIGVQSVAAALVAAVAGLALSFGAQSMIAQFFGGLIIMTTKPFNVGDVVKINGSSDKLIVEKVGIMNTRFRHWESDETYVLPNSQVSEATVVNITGGKDVYAVLTYITLPYFKDYDTVRKGMLEGIRATEHVVNDDDRYKPEFELDSFTVDALVMKITFYIDDYELSDQITSDVREAMIGRLMHYGVDMKPHHNLDIFTKEE